MYVCTENKGNWNIALSILIASSVFFHNITILSQYYKHAEMLQKNYCE